jgi:DNA-binding transcriptional MerR regulator
MTTDRLTIGQFSKLAWLSIKALRLYDELGLLTPAYVDSSSGYRWYEPWQAPRARAIALLRSLDMPLADISELLSAGDRDKLRSLLRLHQNKLEERLEEHRQMLERVEDLIERGTLMAYEITVKDTHAVDVVGVTFATSPENIGPECGRCYGEIAEFLNQEAVAVVGPPRLVYHAAGGDTWQMEACMPVESTPAPRDQFIVRTFPGGEAATTVHVGPYDELGMAYREVERWMAANGRQTAAPPYDVYVNDPAEVDSPAEYITEVVWPLSPAAN